MNRIPWELWKLYVSYAGIILDMGLTNGRRCYIVESSHIGCAHTQNDPYYRIRFKNQIDVSRPFARVPTKVSHY